MSSYVNKGITFYGQLTRYSANAAAAALKAAVDPYTGDPQEAIIKWFYAAEAECKSGRHPSTLLERWYGDLTTGEDTGGYWDSTPRRIGMEGIAAGGYFGTIAWDSSHAAAEDFRKFQQETTVAILLAGMVTNLPPMAEEDDSKVGGFLNYEKRWGLDYDADVEYMLWEDAWSSESGTSSDPFGHPGGFNAALEDGSNYDVALGDWASGIMAENGTWTTVDAYTVDGRGNSMWPVSSTTRLTAGNAWLGQEAIGYAGTIMMEALGFDSRDSVNIFTNATTDANEALHSNEVMQYRPPDVTQAASETYYHPAKDPYIAGSTDLGGSYQITWGETWQTRAAMAKRYHALLDSEDPATGTIPMTNAFTDADGVRRREEAALEVRIIEQCQLIGPELEVTTFPKRLLNNVQKRRKIPDNLVSAFGYVPEDMYDPAAVAEELGDTSADDAVNYVVPGTAMTELEYGTAGGEGRGSAEGTWASTPGGLEWHPYDDPVEIE